MFSRSKKKTSPTIPDSSGNPPAQTDSRRIEEIEKTRRDLMLAALESFGNTATAPMNPFDLGLADPESAEISPAGLHNDSDSASSLEETTESEDQELERQLLLDDYQSAPLEIQKTDPQFTAAGSSAAQNEQSQFDLAEQIRATGQEEKQEKSLQATKSLESVKYEYPLQTEPFGPIESDEPTKPVDLKKQLELANQGELAESTELPEAFAANQNIAVSNSTPPLVRDVEISRLTSPTASPLAQTQPKPLLRPQNHLLDEILIGIVKADIAALCRNQKTIKTS